MVFGCFYEIAHRHLFQVKRVRQKDCTSCMGKSQLFDGDHCHSLSPCIFTALGAWHRGCFVSKARETYKIICFPHGSVLQSEVSRFNSHPWHRNLKRCTLVTPNTGFPECGRDFPFWSQDRSIVGEFLVQGLLGTRHQILSISLMARHPHFMEVISEDLRG